MLLTACQADLSHPGNPGGSSGSGGGPPPTPQDGSWLLTLTASVEDSAADGGRAYNRLVAGQDPEATNGFDNARDVRALFSNSGQPTIQAYFDHAADSGYDMNSNQIWHDIRGLVFPMTWELVVTAANGTNVDLAWKMPAGDVGCQTRGFILTDTGGAVPTTDLCLAGGLNFTADGRPKQFQLSVY